MECPSCSSDVADDAAICPNCDHILDPSLFDASPPEADDEPTGSRPAPAPPPRRAPPPGKRLKKRPPGDKRPPTGGQPGVKRRPPSAMPEAPPPAAREREEKNDWRSQVAAEDWGAANRGPAPAFEPNKGLDPDDMMGDVKQFIQMLSSADKLGFFGLLGIVVSCFFPWKETAADGEILGVMSLGIVSFVAALGAIVALVMRVQNKLQGKNPMLPWIAQLGAIVFSVFWCFIYFRLAWDSTPVRSPFGNMEIWASKPGFGVIAAVIAAGVAGLGTVLGLKDKGR